MTEPISYVDTWSTETLTVFRLTEPIPSPPPDEDIEDVDTDPVEDEPAEDEPNA